MQPDIDALPHGFIYYICAFIFVLALIGLFGVVLKYVTQRGAMPGLLGRANRRRLAIVEHLMIDAHHRLILTRCDNDEYLILVGREHNLQIDLRQSHALGARPESEMAPVADGKENEPPEPGRIMPVLRSPKAEAPENLRPILSSDDDG